MQRIEVVKIGDIKSFIDKMELNVYYDMPLTCRYKWIKIEKEKEYYSREVYYCWAMEYNYNETGRVGYIYPLIGSNKVKHFKTELGAKRNLLKTIQGYFTTLN